MKKKNLVLLCVSVLCFLLGTFEGVDVKAAEAQADYVSMEERNGWYLESDGWHYYVAGDMKTGWQQIDSKWYYFDENGLMETDTWIGNYYVDKEGVWIENYKPAQWVRDGNYWWYRESDGSWPANSWRFIAGKWHYFDASGYMQTGWRFIGGKWYYMDGNGAMQTGWTIISGQWYYMDENGVMQTGWQLISGKWYYMDSNGVMQTGWVQSYGLWYYMDGNGVMRAGCWVQSCGKWYYMDGDGVMQTGWQLIGGKWYHMDWNGVMQTGWQLVSGKWYYMDGSGAMQASVWIGDYYVQSDGSMALNSWIGNCYVDAAGKWVSGSGSDQVYTIDMGNGKTKTVVGHFDTAMSNEIFRLLNEHRKSMGVYTLESVDTRFQTAVNVRGYEIAVLFDHYRPNGGICFDLHPASCAENIAMGFTSAEAFMNAWINSPGHNANMLNTMSSSVGIAVFKEKTAYGYVNYAVQLFSW